MAENILVNGVVYNGVDSISMQNTNGEKVPFYPDAVRYNAQTLTEEQKAQARANIGAQAVVEKETVLSDNLFDKSTATYGKYWHYSSTGPQHLDSADNYTGYVELRGAGTYRTKVNEAIMGSDYAKRVPLLDKNKTWIKNITGTVTATDDRYAYDLEFVVSQSDISEGAAYYPITVYKPYIDTVMAVKDREYPSEYIPYGYIEVETESAPADWNAAEGKPGHVLNRTHWSESEERVLFEETAVEFTEENEYSLMFEGDLIVGNEYRVKWNGAEYSCICEYSNESVPAYIGERAVVDDTQEPSGEPFLALAMEGVIMLFPTGEDTNVTLEIIEVREVFHKLNNKFLDVDWLAKDGTPLPGKYAPVREIVDLEAAGMSKAKIGVSNQFNDIPSDVITKLAEQLKQGTLHLTFSFEPGNYRTARMSVSLSVYEVQETDDFIYGSACCFSVQGGTVYAITVTMSKYYSVDMKMVSLTINPIYMGDSSVSFTDNCVLRSEGGNFFRLSVDDNGNLSTKKIMDLTT